MAGRRGHPDTRRLRTCSVTAVLQPERAIIGRVSPVRRLRAVAADDGGAGAAAELVGRVATGDREAFGELYDLVAPRVHAVSLRVVRDPAMAEEVTQEVMVELWRTAPRFRAEKGSVTAWAATVAHRRAVDRVRSTQSARDRDQRDHDARVAPGVHHDEVAEQVEGRLEREQVGAALDSLSPAQREAIELAYFGGCTYREVAADLGVPEGTVKTRIRDGLARLREHMESTR